MLRVTKDLSEIIGLSLRKEFLYTKTIETLFSVYMRALDQKDTTNDIYRTFLDKMNKDYLENTSDAQKVIDYISGMTDNYLEREYEKYK